jgi:transcription elongation factor GreA
MADAVEARSGASELLRSLGLLVDGPARWGNRVGSLWPGVFLVELPGGAADAPMDIVALRRWIERVPGLMLDGERPTPQELAARLAEHWIPNEPILFVGRTPKQIGARVAAMLATPLGDAKPAAGGHWLRTLSSLNDLRVWWAETEAHEEYEDALIEAVAARSDGRVPFANLTTVDGAPKLPGLTGSLRAADTGAPASATAPKPTARASARAATTRKRTPTLSGAAARPAPAPTYVSRDGLQKLSDELDNLRVNVRPQVIARVKAARELGDLRENGDYEYARKEQSFVEGRILALEQMIKTSVLIVDEPATGAAQLGSTVVVEVGGERETYVLVGPAEANPVTGRISNASPVGRALVGARAGDEVTVQLPSSSVVYRVVEVA